ncbi:glycosyltransferase family 4 protein [Limnobacter profundi]|uniref:Glycosyltransferase family 4 protein n=1 Tax=Limnobacter profundi TaxID=2732163 RepID=A0ABX6N8G4_9BURK|nr:glycosyltransferase family 4 protein [Limnobacter sp. SAORIC-580]QJR30731.1 glycosyltransferase family 4 protein [Limnobacter sp. SAORIC-580]
MKYTVLFVVPEIKPGGGPPGYVYNLLRGCEISAQSGEIKHEFKFSGDISLERNKSTGEVKKKINLRVFLDRLVYKLGLHNYLSSNIYTSKLMIDSADIVVFQGFQDLHLLKYSKKNNKRIGYMPHSPSVAADEYKMLRELNGISFAEGKYKSILAKEKQFFISADFIVFPSEGAAIEYKSKFGTVISNRRVFYIKSGVHMDCERDNEALNYRPRSRNEIFVLFAGRYVSHKGYDLFCEAASLIVGNYPNVRFLTAGDGPMRKSFPSVTDLGWQSNMESLVRSADVIVIPNRVAYYDLFPLECAFHGKPMVMTAVGGNVDQLSDLPDVIPCYDADSVALASAIDKALQTLTKNSRWGQRNKVKFDETFTSDKFAKRWDILVDSFLK